MQKEIIVKVSDVIQRTPSVKSVRVVDPDGSEFKAGQFLSVSLGDGKEWTKWLSFSNSPTEKGYIEFTKRITESAFSKKFNELKQGDSVKIKYPYGNFIFDGQFDKIVFLSGGIGITPIRSMAKFVCDKKLGTDMILLYGNHSYPEIAFREDFEKMAGAHPGFKIVNVLCVEDDRIKSFKGYITADVIRNAVSDIMDRKFFVCGPPKMVASMENILINELKVPAANVLKENFAGY